MDLSGRQTRTLTGCLLLAALTLLAFWHVTQNGFINYDDGDYVTANPHVLTGLTWANVKWAFTATRASNWNPVTWLSHMLDVQLFGLTPQRHHLINLLLHVVDSLLLFLLLLDVTSGLWRSFFVAALFAIHPLHVESVAWVSERKDLLSTLFCWLTLWAYFRYARLRSGQGKLRKQSSSQSPERPGNGWYVLALALYALGLMSKPMLVSLPFVLLLLDYWPLARFTDATTRAGNVIPLVLEKIPFLVLAAVSSVLTFVAQSHNYTPFGGLPIALRVATAITTYLKYLGKTIWPLDLAIFYPNPNARYFAPHQTPFYPASEQWPWWQITAAFVFLAAVSVLVVLRRSREPWLVTGWYWFLVTLVPVIGVVQAGIQVMADRYTYLPLVGIFILTVWSAAECSGRWRSGRIGLACAGAVSLVACLVLTPRQVSYWHDDQTLFRHALAVTSRNSLAEWMVGASYAQAGKPGLAQTHFRLALAADPYQVEAHSALGSLFELEGRTELATNQYEATLRMKPQDEFARVHLAGVLRKLGKTKEALAEYETAARWNPDSIEANYQAGALLLDSGQLDRAAIFLETAVRLKPKHAEALLCLSDLRAQQGRVLDAAAALQQLVLLYPTNFELRVNLGSMLWKAGQRDLAFEQYREASRLNPSEPMIHYDLGTALMARGQPAQASQEFSQALKLKPDYLEAAAALGHAFVAQGKFKEAQGALEQALQLAPTNVNLLVNLGTALLLDGQTNQANVRFARALELEPGLATQLKTSPGR